ncbi:hypothetical protein [Cellvibrio mixtus]|uniref:hypothetical protein n=1 Tax=Cellvibrio mixtus TaxID=39650 RepID=UPI0005876081|nr:hypothetical protein [Cellvibrio mixtus]
MAFRYLSQGPSQVKVGTVIDWIKRGSFKRQQLSAFMSRRKDQMHQNTIAITDAAQTKRILKAFLL